MVYCVQAQLLFSSAARRDAVLSDMQSRIATKQRWGVETLEAFNFIRSTPVNGISARLRFVTKADADDLKARVENFATGPRAPLAGSWIRVHDCSHDEGTDNCTSIVERTW